MVNQHKLFKPKSKKILVGSRELKSPIFGWGAAMYLKFKPSKRKAITIILKWILTFLKVYTKLKLKIKNFNINPNIKI